MVVSGKCRLTFWIFIMKISISSEDGGIHEIELYSREGLELISKFWVKSAFYHRIMYEPTWLGIPIIQLPNDIVLLQELIWKIRPDLIIETGVAHGGSAIFYASILELLGKGSVIGIDIEIRKYNEIAIKSHPLSKRIELLEGSSIDSHLFEEVKGRVRSGMEVLVVLDSNHSYNHVLAEMELYRELISPGGYMVVMDGVKEMLSDIPHGCADWEDDNPLTAIREFLTRYSEWEIDPYYTRTLITCSPNGFLRRCEDESS